MHEHVTHNNTISIMKGSDSIVNESINIPRRSTKGFLLLFYKPQAEGARDSEMGYQIKFTAKE